ncbi:hypothetical protein ACHAXA_002660 [Cyclostephanos tholiformis]|uniref:Uncharacterized protein n=1 Tax=Cyclostephanos tholiformis TaxID=382380 RepID=A0ABD3R2C3_9STRA
MNPPTSGVHKRKHDRLDNLRRSRNRSVLQIVQTLEICAKNGVCTPVITSTRGCPPTRIGERNDSAMLTGPTIIFDVNVCDEHVVEKSEHGNDDDTFLTAISTIPGSVASRVDATVFAANETPLHIGAVTPITKIKPRRRTTPRSPHLAPFDSASDTCDNDLARRIEAMVLETETAYENRPKRTRPSDARRTTAEHANIDEKGRLGRGNKSLISVENAACSTPDRKTHREGMKVATSPSPHSRRRALAIDFFSRAFHTPYSDDVPEMSSVGSTASVSSEWSIGA